MSYVFDPPSAPSIPVAGSSARFPVHRIYCVGRNYAAHAREMGGNPEREPPFFFLKPADALVAPGTPPAYPPGTKNLHHEVELVVAIGRKCSAIPAQQALSAVWGYAVGNDLTRRDLQLAARDKGRPWDFGKAFDQSAPTSEVHPVSAVGHPSSGAIWLTVNGAERQRADLSQMIWSLPEIIAELSMFYTLLPGDLIFTGTPEGVGPLVPGDFVEAGIDGVDRLAHRIGPPK
jgi:fumarylpyruvate hydrolase